MSNLPSWLQGEEALPPPKPPKKSLNPLALIGGLLLICASIWIVGAIARMVAPSAIAVAPTEIPPLWTPAPTSTIAPTNTPAPTATLEPTGTPLPPIEALRVALETKLGVSTHDAPRLIRVEKTAGLDTLFVDWNINHALSDESLKRGARIDAVNLLRIVAENSDGIEYKDVALSGFFPLVDNLGNTRDAMVVQVWYDRSTLEKINWDNFFHNEVYGAAKTLRIHQTFEE